MVELDHLDTWRATNVTNTAGKGFSIGESLTLLSVCIDNEADLGGSSSIVGDGVGLEAITATEGNCKAVSG